MASKITIALFLGVAVLISLSSCQEESNEIIPDLVDKPSVESSSVKVETSTQRIDIESEPVGTNIFSRLIHDIFQIPIQVLKAVRTLLSNPVIGDRHNAKVAARRNVTQPEK